MQESFLHYLFEHQLIQNSEFEIIFPGQKNHDAGPDFFNSKIKIKNTIWVGNVEIHISASDWKKHKHHLNKAYDNIILHLVLKNDADIVTTDGRIIPSYEIKFDPKIYENYENLIQNKNWVHCETKLNKIDSFTINNYIESLAIERLQRKSIFFAELLSFNQNNWEEAFFQALSKGFGGKLNQIPFELLAKSISIKTLLKHQNNLTQIEALLFGQAGFFDEPLDDIDYYNILKKEYQYLKSKYKLEGIRPELWKFSKIRPYNFPTIKIALLSQLIFLHQNLLSKASACKTVAEIESLLNLQASNFWDTHYRFGKKSKKLNKKLGKLSKQHLIINIIIPFLYIYAQETANESLKEICINWFPELDSEDNKITREWEIRGLENPNAMMSQGLIELKNEKCNNHKCIDCRIGHKILTLSWNEQDQQ